MTEKLPSFQGPLAAALKHAIDHLTPASSSSVAATADLATLRKNLSLSLDDSGQDATEIINALVKAVEGGIIDSAGPRFFGWVIGGSLPAALAADWLTSAWDQNAAMYACAPAAAVVEEVVGEWLKDLLHLPATASFALVTGCQMAHVTCLLAARHALLARRQWDVEKEGLAGSPPIRILTSTEIHGSTIRAVRMLGLGEKHITGLPIDADGRLREDSLIEALESSPSQPTIVILQAGDLNIGAFDNFAKLIPIAKKHGAWVHIDGAFGLWCAASPRLRHLLNGAAAADSWTTDGHKWLNVPYDCGYAFVADPAVHHASLSHHASYLTHASDARDQMDWNPEWSRRGRGFATYAALRQLGRQGIADLIDRTCDQAHALVTRIGSLEGAEVIWEPQINQGLVRFHDPLKDPRKGASTADNDTFTDRIMAEILASGEAFFTGTTWHGRRAMRISVCNWQTSAQDVDRVVACINRILRATREKSDVPQSRTFDSMTDMTNHLKNLAESYTAAWCSQNAASVAAFYSPEGSLTINDDPPAFGRAAITEAAQGFMTSFPDLNVVMDDLTIDGERAIYHWTLQGTNTGPGGSGKRVRISGFERWRIGADGLIAESNGHFNSAEYQRQLEHGVGDPGSPS